MKTFWHACAAAAMLLMLDSGRSETSTVTVTGRVLPAFAIEATKVADPAFLGIVLVEQQARDAVRLTVETDSVPRTGMGRVILKLRTNGLKYRLRAVHGGPGPVRVHFDPPRKSGNGLLVAPGAAEAFSPASNTMLSGTSRILAEGSVISARGTFSSPDNALLVPISLEFASAQAGRYWFLFTIGP